MRDPGPGRKSFNVSIGSLVAAFLFFAGFEALIRLCRDLIAHPLTGLLHRFAPTTLRQTPPIDWIAFSVNLTAGLISIVLAVIVGARTLRRRLPIRSQLQLKAER
jgi:divalent metal cation (Fe/Co/Zn/Cd) transporter